MFQELILKEFDFPYNTDEIKIISIDVYVRNAVLCSGNIAKSDVIESDIQSGHLIAVPEDLCDLPPLRSFQTRFKQALYLRSKEEKVAIHSGHLALRRCQKGRLVPGCFPRRTFGSRWLYCPSHIKGSEDCLKTARFHADHQRQEIQQVIADYGDALGVKTDDLTSALRRPFSRLWRGMLIGSDDRSHQSQRSSDAASWLDVGRQCADDIRGFVLLWDSADT